MPRQRRRVPVAPVEANISERKPSEMARARLNGHPCARVYPVRPSAMMVNQPCRWDVAWPTNRSTARHLLMAMPFRPGLCRAHNVY